MDQEPEASQVERISRRRALKRIGAAGAAVAWSAPLLSSLRTPAFAQASPRCREGFSCGGDFETCSDSPFCVCTSTVDGAECLDTNCTGLGVGCTTNDQCETLVGPGARCQPAGTGCCGNQCIAACGGSGLATDARAGRNTG